MAFKDFTALFFMIFAFSLPFSTAQNQITFGGGTVTVTWTYLSASDEIEFELKVQTTGYVALGLSLTQPRMTNLDLFAGGVSASPWLKDYHVSSYAIPAEDTQQDYTLLSATEQNGFTTVRCKRKLNTGDSKDVQIQAGSQVYIAVAYHSSTETLTTYHTSRYYSSQPYVLVPVPPPPPPTLPSSSTPALAAASTPALAAASSSTPALAPSSSVPALAPPSSSVPAPSSTPTPAPPLPLPPSSLPPPPSSSSSSSSTTPYMATTAIKPTTAVTTSTTPPSTASPTITPVTELSFVNGNCRLSWRYDPNNSELFFKVIAKTTGWVGVGISLVKGNMVNMDIVVGGVTGGQGYLWDYHSKSTEQSPVRLQRHDYKLISAVEAAGTTTVEYKRKLDTGDTNKLVITPGASYYLAVAAHGSSDTFSFHTGFRAYSDNKIMLVASQQTTTATPTTTNMTTIGNTSAPMTTVAIATLILAVIASLLVSQ